MAILQTLWCVSHLIPFFSPSSGDTYIFQYVLKNLRVEKKGLRCDMHCSDHNITSDLFLYAVSPEKLGGKNLLHIASIGQQAPFLYVVVQ